MKKHNTLSASTRYHLRIGALALELTLPFGLYIGLQNEWTALAWLCFGGLTLSQG